METITFDPDGDLVLVLDHPQRTPRVLIAPVLCRAHDDSTVELQTGPELPARLVVPTQLRMLVSSKHMTLASSVFKAMLNGHFREGRQLAEVGNVEIPLPDDDPTAFTILLDIIHALGSNVPRKVSLPLLTDISVLVDKYRLHEVAKMFSDVWVDGLKEELPMKYSDSSTFADSFSPSKVFRWIAISWIFDRSAEFKHATLLAQMGCMGDIGLENYLPIPRPILDAILKTRDTALSSAFSTIDDLIVRYQFDCIQCDGPASRAVACDAMVLGSLVRHFGNPKPQDDCSLDAVLRSIRSCLPKTLCNELKHMSFSSSPRTPRKLSKAVLPPEDHGISDSLTHAVRIIEKKVVGLDIEMFKQPGKSDIRVMSDSPPWPVTREKYRTIITGRERSARGFES